MNTGVSACTACPGAGCLARRMFYGGEMELNGRHGRALRATQSQIYSLQSFVSIRAAVPAFI